MLRFLKKLKPLGFNFANLSLLQPLPPESPTTSDHLRPLQPRKGERGRKPPMWCTSRHRRVTLSSFSLPPSLPPPSSIAATTLLQPLSRRRLRCCCTSILCTSISYTVFSCTSFSVFSTTVVSRFVQGKFLTRFCLIFRFLYINFQFRLLQVLSFIGIEIVWIVCIYYELALVSHLRFNTKIMYCPRVFILKKLHFF